MGRSLWANFHSLVQRLPSQYRTTITTEIKYFPHNIHRIVINFSRIHRTHISLVKCRLGVVWHWKWNGGRKILFKMMMTSLFLIIITSTLLFHRTSCALEKQNSSHTHIRPPNTITYIFFTFHHFSQFDKWMENPFKEIAFSHTPLHSLHLWGEIWKR